MSNMNPGVVRRKMTPDKRMASPENLAKDFQSISLNNPVLSPGLNKIDKSRGMPTKPPGYLLPMVSPQNVAARMRCLTDLDL